MTSPMMNTVTNIIVFKVLSGNLPKDYLPIQVPEIEANPIGIP